MLVTGFHPPVPQSWGSRRWRCSSCCDAPGRLCLQVGCSCCIKHGRLDSIMILEVHASIDHDRSSPTSAVSTPGSGSVLRRLARACPTVKPGASADYTLVLPLPEAMKVTMMSVVMANLLAGQRASEPEATVFVWGNLAIICYCDEIHTYRRQQQQQQRWDADEDVGAVSGLQLHHFYYQLAHVTIEWIYRILLLVANINYIKQQMS